MTRLSQSKMSRLSYPSLYRCADAASLQAQSKHLLLNKLYLGSLVLSGIASAFAGFGNQAMHKYLYIGVAVVLIMGLMILWVIRARQDDKTWFDGRAVAESVKTATWRFMMKDQPFNDDSNAEALFLAGLKEIREARPHLAKHLTVVMDVEGTSITDFMKEQRSSSLEERRAYYISNRIRDQKVWYAQKAKSNADIAAKWYWLIVILQAVVIVLAIVQAATAGLRIDFVPVVTTCVAVMTAWSQMKRYDELAQSYALAAQELEEIEAIAANQASEDAFSQLVEQAEDSISREHTMWCARRDVRLSRRAAINVRGGQTYG